MENIFLKIKHHIKKVIPHGLLVWYRSYKNDGYNESEPFCASAWAEGVLGHSGQLRVCAKQDFESSLGNWQELGLAQAYNSEKAIQFRESVMRGIAPNHYCKNCIDTGTVRTLSSILQRGAGHAVKEIQALGILASNFSKLETLFQILNHNSWSPELRKQVKTYKQFLFGLSKKYAAANVFFNKLLKIVAVCESYFNRALVVPVIIPMRQVSLKSKCNARCIHCPGKFSGWIFDDTVMAEQYYKTVFSHPDDMVDFFMNGAEFLFVDNWKGIVELLRAAHIKPAISTNGILLTQKNIQFLIDNQCVNELNISLDGASKEMVESIRVNVNYDKLMNSLEFLFSYAQKKHYPFSLSFSFVLMKRNFMEFPEMIKRISELKNKISSDKICPKIYFGCTDLDPFNVPGYNEFVMKEHIETVEPHELIDMFRKCKEYSDYYGVYVGMFKTYDINSYLSAGCPIPQRAEHHKPAS